MGLAIRRKKGEGTNSRSGGVGAQMGKRRKVGPGVKRGEFPNFLSKEGLTLFKLVGKGESSFTLKKRGGGAGIPGE